MKIILEKNNNSLKNYKVDDTDYTKDVKAGDTSKGDDLYDVGDTDYTQDESVKYSESKEEVTPDTFEDDETIDSSNPDDGEDTTDSTDDTDATDYTEDVSSDETEDDNTDDMSSDETEDSSSDTDTTEETDEQKESESESQDALMNDFIELYKVLGSTINKLNSVKNNNVAVMSVHVQIIKNLSLLEKYTFNYILVFKNHSYTQNLYKYNYFIEAFRINIQMLEMVKTIKI